MNTKDLKTLIESFAPENLQEDWDNTGYNVDLHNEFTNVFLCLDVTPDLIQEAASRGSGAVISHHPLLFHAVKRVDAGTHQGACLRMLLKHGLSLYCAHTSMDSSPEGINYYLADKLGLVDVRPLIPAQMHAWKVVFTAPAEAAAAVASAACAAGGGRLGSYADCTFTSSGTGTFRPLEGAAPYVGSVGELSTVPEQRVELLVLDSHLHDVLDAVRAVHPYEEAAVDVLRLEDVPGGGAGLGCIGALPQAATAEDFAKKTAQVLGCTGVRCSGRTDAHVRHVAVCGGGAGDLAERAAAQGADLFLTGEVKHNQYYESSIPIVEAGHYATEKCFIPAMKAALQKHSAALQYKLGVFVPSRMKSPYIVV